MTAEHALQLWRNSASEGLPQADCTLVQFERLLHLELRPPVPPEALQPAVRLLVHLVVAAYGYSDTRPGKRRSPSAGARYPVECLVLSWQARHPQAWLVSLNCGGVRPLGEAFAAQVARATHAEPGETCVVVVASLWKTIERYGLAGVRYSVYVAGHVVANLCVFAHDEGWRLDTELRVQARSVFRELSNNVFALYAVRVAAVRPFDGKALTALRWPQAAPAAATAPVHIDPPSFSPLLARARRLFATMGRELQDRPLPICSPTRGRRAGTDWLEARHSVKGFVPRPAAAERDSQHLRPFLLDLSRQACQVHALDLGLAYFRRRDDGHYSFDGAVCLRDDNELAASHGAQAFLEACNGQNQVPNAEGIAVLFVQLAHLPEDERLAAAAAAQSCIGLLSSEIYRYCAITGVGTTMLCGFSSQRLGELLAGNADWPLAVHLFGRGDAAGWKTDTHYLQ